ncbi:hypothetical protein K461DRAFT_276921 [Myriangium duriaei CBS 260.36]|uniref:Uncharacterized protein n=1 Tax=Myriangium duriaei CBS 260.36 TaxID=1168546 RepID=A0A9P4MI38_9PEZI|nr:hypothetical protein K461DRAFT_276921 [Myriangium duriaei CBS 260.36]
MPRNEIPKRLERKGESCFQIDPALSDSSSWEWILASILEYGGILWYWSGEAC